MTRDGNIKPRKHTFTELISENYRFLNHISANNLMIPESRAAGLSESNNTVTAAARSDTAGYYCSNTESAAVVALSSVLCCCCSSAVSAALGIKLKNDVAEPKK